MNSNGNAIFLTAAMLLLCLGPVLSSMYFSSEPEPEPAAEFCAEELTQRVLTSEGKLEVSTHCVRREPYVLPEAV